MATATVNQQIALAQTALAEAQNKSNGKAGPLIAKAIGSLQSALFAAAVNPTAG